MMRRRVVVSDAVINDLETRGVTHVANLAS